MEKATTRKFKKIAILGAESTGKSTISKALAEHYHTIFVPEYARTYFETHDINHYGVSDLEIIAKNQLELEKECESKATDYLLCDTSLITVKIWAVYQFNKSPEFITNTIKAADYDLYLICNNDVAWIEDPQRRNENLRESLFKWTKHELQKLNIDYKIIKGTGDERLKSAITTIDAFFKD